MLETVFRVVDGGLDILFVLLELVDELGGYSAVDHSPGQVKGVDAGPFCGGIRREFDGKVLLELLLDCRHLETQSGGETSIEHASLETVVGDDIGDGVEALEGVHDGGVERELLRGHGGQLLEILVGDDQQIIARYLEEGVFVLGIALGDVLWAIAEEG